LDFGQRMCENRKLFAQQWNATFSVCFFRGFCCLRAACLFVCFPNFLGAFRTHILVFLKHFTKCRNFVVLECNWRSSGRCAVADYRLLLSFCSFCWPICQPVESQVLVPGSFSSLGQLKSFFLCGIFPTI